MGLKKAQKDVEEWVSQYTEGYWPPLAIMSRLTEETGELAREVNHRFGPKKKKAAEQTAEVADEIADIVFTLCCLANSQNIDLDEAWEKMMLKYKVRDEKRFEKKEAKI